MAQTLEAEIIRQARAVARWQRECRDLRRKLKTAETELRTAKRHLRACVGAGTRTPDVPPMRLFGERQTARKD